jgi:hypothetical protein
MHQQQQQQQQEQPWRTHTGQASDMCARPLLLLLLLQTTADLMQLALPAS